MAGELPKFERPRTTNPEVAKKLEKMGVPDPLISQEEADSEGLKPVSEATLKAMMEDLDRQRRLDEEHPLPVFKLPPRIKRG